MNQFDFLKGDDEDDGQIRINTSRGRKAAPVRKAKPAPPGVMANVLAFLMLAACVGGCLMCIPNASEETKAEFEAAVNADRAMREAQRHITTLLKAPASAKWPSMFSGDSIRGVGKLPDGTYIVSSYVDSQNGFGAMIRTPFKVHLRLRKDQRAEILGTEIKQ